MLGIVDFSIFPHLDSPDRPDKNMAEAERWAAGIKGPALRHRRSNRYHGDRRQR